MRALVVGSRAPGPAYINDHYREREAHGFCVTHRVSPSSLDLDQIDAAQGLRMSDIQNIAAVFPVTDMTKAVRHWSAMLGVAPTFVDGERWAQFDVNGRRVALAGTDRMSDAAGLMIKVGDIEAASRRLTEAGVGLGPIEEGPHETRRLIDSPEGWALVLYAPRPS